MTHSASHTAAAHREDFCITAGFVIPAATIGDRRALFRFGALRDTYMCAGTQSRNLHRKSGFVAQ
jgi:hypothetical protein